MNGGDAMGDEMGNSTETTGAAFADRVRETLAVPPSEDVSRRHLAAIVAAARDATQSTPQTEARRTPPRRAGFVMRAARWAASGLAAAVTASAVAAGLSFAGVVTLPEPARHAFASIGITLPDGSPERSRTTSDPAGSTAQLSESRPEGRPHPSPHGKPDQADAADHGPKKGSDDSANTEPPTASDPDMPGDTTIGSGLQGDADDSAGDGGNADSDSDTPPPSGDSAP